jgi:V/A-type H+-transporting ATPase subunit D
MGVKFQYNKTSLQALDKQLQIRLRALPTLKNKESALRMEVKHAKNRINELEKTLEKIIEDQDRDLMMWEEFDATLIEVREVRLGYKKIAGVAIPELDEVLFHVREYDLFTSPKWYPAGIKLLKELMRLVIEQELTRKKYEMLEYARRKATQKVNLYEKVQVPAYEAAIRKIKRYLEDEDNLAKAAQKIVKTRQQETTEAGV